MSSTLLPTISTPSASGHCEPGALTNSFGLLIQAILAALAFASLVLKRALEPAIYRRPWLVWFYDTSKQAAGAGVIHILNVFLAQLFTGDPCTWYIVSFLLDSTLGLAIIYLAVKLIACIARRRNYPTLRFGDYGKPPACRPWAHQCLAFIAIIIIEKAVITIVIQAKFWRDVREIILAPIKDPRIELILVMLVVPFVLNTFMFWMVDSLTMLKLTTKKRTPGGKVDDEGTEKLLDSSSSSSVGVINECSLMIDDDEQQRSPRTVCVTESEMKFRHNSLEHELG